MPGGQQLSGVDNVGSHDSSQNWQLPAVGVSQSSRQQIQFVSPGSGVVAATQPAARQSPSVA